MGKRFLAIAGGVGGAKLALGLSRILPPEQLTVAINTGDDETFHGLHVSPDIDTVTYTLAGIVNDEMGWGLKEDSFHTLSALERLGTDTWFRLGDLDFATHIRRTDALRKGKTLTETTSDIAERLGIRHPLVPMSDDPVRTVALTDEGELAFQDYFVRRRCEPRITGVRFDGAESARPAPQFRVALDECDVLIFCPSNPLVSIGPMLAVPGVQQAIERFNGVRIAVSPIVGGHAIKGPAAKMMAELGEDVSCVGVARRYAGLCDIFVIDSVDAAHADAVAALGMRPHVTNTIMETEADKVGLAGEIARLAE